MGYTTSTIHGIDVPDSSQANNIPTDLGKIVTALEGGSLVKRLTSTQINALTSAQKPAGLLVFNSTTNKLQVSNGATFTDVIDASGGTMGAALAMGTNKITGLGTPTAATDAATKGYVDVTLPIGAVITFAGTSGYDAAVWQLCDGSAISRTTYADLFTALGTTHGAGNGTSTFNVPDLRGRFVVASGSGTGLTSRTLGANGGAETHTLTAAESGVPAHSHPITDKTHYHAQKVSAGIGDNGEVVRRDYESDGAGTPYQQGVNTDSSYTGITGTNNNTAANASSAHNNMPPFYALAYLIRKA